MKSKFLYVFASLVLFASISVVQAQFDSPVRYDAASVDALVDRVHADLNHAYSAFKFTKGDRDRLNDAEKQLREFARKWDKGHFDKDELDDSISRIQHVFDNNHLPLDDRDALSSDLTQLRRMREAYNRHEIEGTRH